MAFTINIDEAAIALNRYPIQLASEIYGPLREKMVSEAAWSPVTAKNSYSAPRIDLTGDFVQAFQCPVTPHTTTIELEEEMYKLEQLKIDLVWSCNDFEMFWDSFWADYYQWGSGKELTEWDFPRWVYANHIMPKIEHDMEMVAAYHATKTAVTANTPHPTANSVTGMKKRIADGITSGSIPAGNVITTVAMTLSNAAAVIEGFVYAIPELHRSRGGVIYCSRVVAEYYMRDLYEQGKTVCCDLNAVKNPGIASTIMGAPIFGTNITLVPLPSMTGSQRLIFSSQPRNLIWGRKEGEAAMPSLRFQVQDRTLKGLAEFHRFYGYRDGRFLFVNNLV